MKIKDVVIGMPVIIKCYNKNCGCADDYMGKTGRIIQHNKGDNFCYLDIDVHKRGIWLSEIEPCVKNYRLYQHLIKTICQPS